MTDPRATAPSTRTSGRVPALAAAVVEESLAELGLPGLVLAGAPAGCRPPGRRVRMGGRPRLGQPGKVRPAWHGLLDPGHRFPAYSVTKLITATMVLRFAADGRVGLDDPANAYLRTVRLADDTVTVRDLLTHTAGVDSPAGLFAEQVPDLVTLTGLVASGTARGVRSATATAGTRCWGSSSPT